jgi:uncharacterized protein YgiB involved in biofilm formation
LRGLVIASAAATLSGCDEPDPNAGQIAAYATADQCAADGLVTNADCREADREARAEHAALAPRYEDWSDCQEDYEQCEDVNEGGRVFFVPRYAGYIVAELIDEAGDYAKAKRRRPLYRTRDGSVVVSGGAYVPGYGRYPVTRSGVETLGSRTAEPQRFSRGFNQTRRYGGVGDPVTRAAYSRTSVAMSGGDAPTTMSRGTVSRGGFGSSSFGRGG